MNINLNVFIRIEIEEVKWVSLVEIKQTKTLLNMKDLLKYNHYFN